MYVHDNYLIESLLHRFFFRSFNGCRTSFTSNKTTAMNLCSIRPAKRYVYTSYPRNTYSILNDFSVTFSSSTDLSDRRVVVHYDCRVSKLFQRTFLTSQRDIEPIR